MAPTVQGMHVLELQLVRTDSVHGTNGSSVLDLYSGYTSMAREMDSQLLQMMTS